MHAIISDIHGNLEALDAVSAAIVGLDVICLGDVVCYGPDSNECIRRSANWGVALSGPLDLSVLDLVPGEWNPKLSGYIRKTRERIDSSHDADFLLETLGSYSSSHAVGGLRFFHGTLTDARGWIFPEEIYSPTNIEMIAGTSDHVHISGGSHIPGIFRRIAKNEWNFIEPEEGESYDLPRNEKTVLTIGSVGQPRDGDSRAAYAIIDDTTVVFHRVEYNIDLTCSKIRDDPDIDDMQGGRLPSGR